MGYAFITLSFNNHQLEMKESENLADGGATRWKERGSLNHDTEGTWQNILDLYGEKKIINFDFS